MAKYITTDHELRHANYKYIKREWKNGKWQYTYEQAQNKATNYMRGIAKKQIEKDNKRNSAKQQEKSNNKNFESKLKTTAGKLNEHSYVKSINDKAAERMHKENEANYRNVAKQQYDKEKTSKLNDDANKLKTATTKPTSDLKSMNSKLNDDYSKSINNKAAERMHKENEANYRNVAKQQLDGQEGTSNKSTKTASMNKKLSDYVNSNSKQIENAKQYLSNILVSKNESNLDMTKLRQASARLKKKNR